MTKRSIFTSITHVECGDYEWPAFDRDKDRIKFNSLFYKNADVVDAFFDAYGEMIDKSNIPSIANIVPGEIRIGDVITIQLGEVSKSQTIFDAPNVKREIVSSINLFKYKRFKNNECRGMEMRVQVINMNPRKIVVDPIAPIFDDWLKMRIDDPTAQRNLKRDTSILVRNLKQTKAGFIGSAVIDTVSDFVGEEYSVKAFIPGSQIALNIAQIYSQYEGKDVRAFALNYLTSNTGTDQYSLICSVKEYLKFEGEKQMVMMFNEYCANTSVWKDVQKNIFKGFVTGVINSNKKCGVFVEIPAIHITGMVSVPADELVQYAPFMECNVQITEFEEMTYFNDHMNQIQHEEPFVIDSDILKNVTIKPILKFA